MTHEFRSWLRRVNAGRVGRWRLLGLLAVTLVAGCAGTPLSVQLYHLPAQPPVPVTAPVPSTERWQLMLPVRVPDYLDREALLLPQGQTGLMALSGHRWAESLRDSVPRILRQDLATLLGAGSVWAAPVPPGVTITRQLRVELVALEVERDRSAVRLHARWTIGDPAGTVPPRTDELSLRVPASGGEIDALVAAHRLALWRLAERITGVR